MEEINNKRYEITERQKRADRTEFGVEGRKLLRGWTRAGLWNAWSSSWNWLVTCISSKEEIQKQQY